MSHLVNLLMCTGSPYLSFPLQRRFLHTGKDYSFLRDQPLRSSRGQSPRGDLVPFHSTESSVSADHTDQMFGFQKLLGEGFAFG